MAILKDEGYLEYLKDIQIKLNDFIDFVNQGKVNYLTDIALKLRILYMDKSGTPALFKKIQQIFGFEIIVWVKPTIVELIEKGELSESLRPSSIIYSPALTWLNRGREKQDLISAFQRDAQVIIDNHSFSVKKIVEIVADKMGGAHIDKKVADKDLILHKNDILFNNFNIANKIIFETARTTVEIIGLILEKIENGKESDYIIKN